MNLNLKSSGRKNLNCGSSKYLERWNRPAHQGSWFRQSQDRFMGRSTTPDCSQTQKWQ